MSQQGIRTSAAAVVRLYQLYREAVTAHPYNPVRAGETFAAWQAAMGALSAAARRRVGRRLLDEEDPGAAVARAARALPLDEAAALRFLTQARILLEAGATVDGLLAGMSRATPATQSSYAVDVAERAADDGPPSTWPVKLSGTQGGLSFTVRVGASGAALLECETADGVERWLVASEARARGILGLRDEVD